MNFCPHCGKELHPEQKFCGSCGKSISDLKSTVTQTQINTNIKPCPACNKDVGITASKCPHCGTSFNKSIGQIFYDIRQGKLIWPSVLFFYLFFTSFGIFSIPFGDNPKPMNGKLLLVTFLFIVFSYGLIMFWLSRNGRKIIKLEEVKYIRKIFIGIMTTMFLIQLLILILLM